MKTIPSSAAHYRSTPVFTQDTIPAALQRAHTTAADVWGRITILEGSLLYRITDARRAAEELLLTRISQVSWSQPSSMRLPSSAPSRSRLTFIASVWRTQVCTNAVFAWPRPGPTQHIPRRPLKVFDRAFPSGLYFDNYLIRYLS